jgi:hypothetical protein
MWRFIIFAGLTIKKSQDVLFFSKTPNGTSDEDEDDNLW